MTLRGSADVGFVLIAGRNVIGRVTSLDDGEEEVLEDTTPIGVADDEWAPVGQSVFELSQEGIFDDDAGALNEALALTAKAPLMYAPAGNTLGLSCICVDALRTTYQRLGARGTLHKANAVYKSDAGPNRGKIQHTLAARTTAGPTDTATIDNDGSSAGGAVGYLGMTALNLDGGTNVAIVIRDSTDDIAYADLITFAVVTSLSDALRAQRVAVTGTVDRYTQGRHTFNGGAGGSRTATFAVGLTRL